MKRLYLYLAMGLLLILPLVAPADDDHEESSGSQRLKITEAKWKDEESRLVVKGQGKNGKTVTVTSSSGQLLGKARVKKEEWKLNSTLSYFRLPPEASSQGVLSSSVSFMNDAGNTIWRWLRSW